jgi:hypothetical protein
VLPGSDLFAITLSSTHTARRVLKSAPPVVCCAIKSDTSEAWATRNVGEIPCCPRKSLAQMLGQLLHSSTECR